MRGPGRFAEAVDLVVLVAGPGVAGPGTATAGAFVLAEGEVTFGEGAVETADVVVNDSAASVLVSGFHRGHFFASDESSGTSTTSLYAYASRI